LVDHQGDPDNLWITVQAGDKLIARTRLGIHYKRTRVRLHTQSC
jgi:hypothetical protein